MERKREGFKDQKSITLPHFLEGEMKARPLTKLLFLTAIGFYPVARYHFRERNTGSDQNILIYCIEGEGWIELSGELHRVHKDQFFIIPAHVPHKYGSENSDPWTIYWIHFTGEIAADFVKNDFPIENANPIGNTDNDRRISLFEEIYRNLSMGFSHENLDYSSVCLWHLLGTFCYVSQYERLISVQQNDIIEKSILYMQRHISKKINLSDLALHCGLSIPQYSQIFKKKTLSSPMKYYSNQRIQRSCQMLDFTNMNIKEIANHLDFEDQFYFSRLFKKVMGVSPAEYRKRKKG